MDLGAGGNAASARGPIAVVIPAHNEASVIGRGLRSLLESARPGEFDVVVVINGSSDATADKARLESERLGYPIRVVEVAAASKIGALRAADDLLREAAAGARIYLDADVVLTTQAARALVDAIDTPAPRLAVAKLDVDASLSSWPVRRYYRAWTALPYVANQVAGSGVFAMNGAGAARIASWPDVINDDGYAARCFDADQRVLVDATFRAFAARSISALVRRRARIVNGNRQLDAMMPAPTVAAGNVPDGQNGLGALVSAVRAGKLDWLSGVVFTAVTVSARVLAAFRRLTGGTARWSTDRTTREAHA
jgi:glycosyltransferase involved in cell wall biosynthesis